jgi:hypothetical protein
MFHTKAVHGDDICSMLGNRFKYFEDADNTFYRNNVEQTAHCHNPESHSTHPKF